MIDLYTGHYSRSQIIGQPLYKRRNSWILLSLKCILRWEALLCMFGKASTQVNPAHQYTVNPAHQYTVNPAHQYTVNPAHQYTVNLVHQYTVNPVHQYTVNPAHQYTVNPAHQYTVFRWFIDPLLCSPVWWDSGYPTGQRYLWTTHGTGGAPVQWNVGYNLWQLVVKLRWSSNLQVKIISVLELASFPEYFSLLHVAWECGIYFPACFFFLSNIHFRKKVPSTSGLI